MHHTTAALEREMHIGMGEGDPGEHLHHVGGLGAIRLQKAAPHRHIEEEVANLHHRARGGGTGSHRTLLATIDLDLRPTIQLRGPTLTADA